MPSVSVSVEADVATRSDGIAAGAGNHLPVGDYGGADYRSAMRFPLPAGFFGFTSITKATLSFYISDHQHVGPKNSSIYCSRMTQATLWTKSAGTQSCESGFSGSNNTQYDDIQSTSTDRVSFSSGSTANAAKSVDVTAAVRSYWANPAITKMVFVFDNNGSDQYTEIWADEKSGYNATLVIDYVAQSPPTAPTLGAPADNLTTADDTPTFTWTHNDPQGDAQSSAEWQLYTSAGVAIGGPVTIAGATASYTPAALARGATYKWSVRTADAANGFGPFATQRTFTVKANPAVTIDTARYMEYSGGAPRLRVKWTVASGTQYKYRVTAPGYDSGLLTSTSQSHLLSTLALTNGTAVNVTVYVETSDPLNGSASRSFTPRWGLTVHRRDLGVAPTGWGTPTVVQTVPSGAQLVMEYGSNPSAAAAPTAWFAALSSAPKARYVYWRAWFIPSSTAGPTLDKVIIPSTASVEVVDKWSTTKDGVGLASGYDIDTGEYVYGSRSIHNVVAGAGPYICYSYGVKVRAGRSYILTGLMKSVGASGAQFRLVDEVGTVTNEDGVSIASIVDEGPPLVQTLDGDVDWFTPDGRDVNRYKTPVWVSPSDQTVWVVLRTGGVAGSQAWFDAIKLEESTVATPWSPASVGAAIVDAGGVQIDGQKGGIFRYRGATGGTRDTVEGGDRSLRFGGDTDMYSPGAGAVTVLSPPGVQSVVQSTAGAGGRSAVIATVSGDSSPRAVLWGDNVLAGVELGPGNAGRDVNLYRSAANVLKTDDQFVAVGGLVLPRGSVQTLAAGTAIVPNAGYVTITTSGAIVPTVAPTIANGSDGQILVILYSGAGSWQARDQSNLASSNLRLSTATYTMGDRDTLTLMWMASTTNWVELARSANL
jgi:hypothetical protein